MLLPNMRVPDADPPDSADMVIQPEMRRQVGCDSVMMLIAAQIDRSETHFISKGAQINLFLWILGAVLMAAAIPVVIGRTRNTDERPRIATAIPSPANAAEPVIEPVSAPAAATPRQPPASQVWQCVANGQKTFSDSPCGAVTSVRQLSEVNRMDAAPVARAPAYPAYRHITDAPTWASVRPSA